MTTVDAVAIWAVALAPFCKYLATNKEEIVGDAAGNVAVVIVDTVELQSMFENLFYHHFK